MCSGTPPLGGGLIGPMPSGPGASAGSAEATKTKARCGLERLVVGDGGIVGGHRSFLCWELGERFVVLQLM